MKALIVACAMSLLPGQQNEADEPAAAQEWLEIFRLDYDASVLGRKCAANAMVGPLAVDHLQNGGLGVFMARLVPELDHLKDLRVMFVDEEGNRFEGVTAMQSSREVEEGTLAAVMYASPDDCPKDSIRGIVFEHASTCTLKMMLEEEKKAREAFEAKVAEVIEDCPLPKPVVGQPCPFALTCIGGEEVSTKKWEGKVVMVQFWATWCTPCLVEIPELRKLYEEYHHEGLEILGVSLDRDRNDLERFVLKEAIAWPQFFVGDEVRRGALMQVTGVTGIPRYFVIDRAGKLHTDQGRGLLKNIVPKLLNEPD